MYHLECLLFRLLVPFFKKIYFRVENSRLGDQLIITPLIKRFKEQYPDKELCIQVHQPLLFLNNPDISEICDLKSVRRNLKMPLIRLSYMRPFRTNPLLKKHYIDTMASYLGLDCRHQNYVYLTSDEINSATRNIDRVKPYLVISVMTSDHFPYRMWSNEKWQVVIDELSKDFLIVHLGDAREPIFNHVHRLAGTVGLREAIAIIQMSKGFIGVESFLMHISNAVNVPAVIVLSGVINRELISYSNVTFVSHAVTCSPCWKRDGCEHLHKCMTHIQADAVIDAFNRTIGNGLKATEPNKGRPVES